MSHLSEEKKCAIIAALCEGVSIRGIERLQEVHRDSVMRLGMRVGEGCAVLHGKIMNNLHVSRLELDEMWSFVKKKRRNVKETDPEEVGDQYIFLALDGTGKAIISWLVGKRSGRNTIALLDDVRRRVLGTPEISTDGFPAYLKAVDLAFDGAANHGVVDKQTIFIAADGDKTGYYAREKLVGVKRTPVTGAPAKISTSYIERVNLSLRMAQRRFTRLTNGFSKKYENHCAAVALFVMHYNFCRVHETLRITPAMQLGVTDHIWTISELVNAALSGKVQTTVAAAKSGFRVIQGGKS